MGQAETRDQMDLRAICESTKSNAEDITEAVLERWDRIGEAEAWQRLPPDLDFDHLPQLIRDLAGASLCTEFDREMCATLVKTAAGHGQYRKQQEFGENLIYREYHLLRRALWEQMKETHGDNATVYYATMRVDTLISLATAAALHGLHRPAHEDRDDWPDMLDRLLDGWPLPPD